MLTIEQKSKISDPWVDCPMILTETMSEKFFHKFLTHIVDEEKSYKTAFQSD